MWRLCIPAFLKSLVAKGEATNDSTITFTISTTDFAKVLAKTIAEYPLGYIHKFYEYVFMGKWSL